MAPNPGEKPKPLSRIPSGGELPIVVLALKTILSKTEALGPLIFDEVDAGIGGKTAEKCMPAVLLSHPKDACRF